MIYRFWTLCIRIILQVNYRLLDGVVSLFETHAVEVKMNEADKETLQRSIEEGKILFNF